MLPFWRPALLGVALSLPLVACSGGPAPAEDSVSAIELCNYLEVQLPQWQRVGSEAGAAARINTALVDFYEGKGQAMSAASVDEHTRRSCPQVRTDVLATFNADSFEVLS